MNKKHIFIFTVLIATSFTLIACHLSFTNVITGSGNVTTETRDVSGFDAVELNGVGRLYIIQGDAESLDIEAEDNIMDELSSDVQGGTLTLGYNDNFWNTTIIPTEEIIYTLTITDLTKLTINGAGDLNIEDLAVSSLDITINGAGEVEIDNLTADNLSIQISGTATIDIAGQVSEQTINIDGAGNYQAGDLQSDSALVSIQGLGGARVWAEEVLTIEIDGGGSVNYYGSPQVSQQINGLGEITHLGDK